jgi:hypothetical protein
MNSTKVKMLEYSILVVFIFLLITSHFDFPPSSYFASIYCNVFNTNEYPPMLITGILTLIYAIPIYFIKKKLIINKD